MIPVLVKAFYGLFAAIYLAAGVSVLLLGSGLLPGGVRQLMLEIGQDNPNTLHIMQEFASTLVFVGLITLWFIRNYDRSRPFHWAMTVFWGLVALVHWFDIRGSFQLGIGPAINSIPFALFVIIGVLRERKEPSAEVG
jgi:hypothetical protein